MVHGAADISMREYDPRRFGAYAKKDWQVVKAREDYCLRHEIPFPHFNRLAGRPVKPGPLYERLKAKGAVYEELMATSVRAGLQPVTSSSATIIHSGAPKSTTCWQRKVKAARTRRYHGHYRLQQGRSVGSRRRTVPEWTGAATGCRKNPAVSP